VIVSEGVRQVVGPPFWRFGVFWAISPLCHKLYSHQKQVSKREQREELGAVLGETPVAGLHVTELALDDLEGMLDLAPDHRDDALDPLVERMPFSALRRFAHDTPDLAGVLERGRAFGAHIHGFSVSENSIASLCRPLAMIVINDNWVAV